MSKVVPFEVRKKPVFSNLTEAGDQAIAYQAYLALQKLILQNDRTAFDALLADEKLEERLTQERPELQPMGVTILAALRALIDRERKEVETAPQVAKPLAQEKKSTQKKERTKRFTAAPGTIVEKPKRQEKVEANFTRHLIVRKPHDLYNAGRLTTSIEVRVASVLGDSERETMLQYAPLIKTVQVASKIQHKITPQYRKRLEQLNIELTIVS